MSKTTQTTTIAALRDFFNAEAMLDWTNVEIMACKKTIEKTEKDARISPDVKTVEIAELRTNLETLESQNIKAQKLIHESKIDLNFVPIGAQNRLKIQAYVETFDLKTAFKHVSFIDDITLQSLYAKCHAFIKAEQKALRDDKAGRSNADLKARFKDIQGILDDLMKDTFKVESDFDTMSKSTIGLGSQYINKILDNLFKGTRAAQNNKQGLHAKDSYLKVNEFQAKLNEFMYLRLNNVSLNTDK